jgi:hypothetical protein
METPPLGPRTPAGDEWPRISVVTPSYQHGAYLEETIRSVLLQGYPDLEYIVLDGGSSDESSEIIARYSPWLASWRSEPDGGQVAAINEGLGQATGRWRTWLNSDDCYGSGALGTVGSAPLSSEWIVGRTAYIDDEGRRIGEFPRGYRRTSLVEDDNLAWIDMLCARWSGTALPQQSSFCSDTAFDAVGLLDPSLHFTFEGELWVRLAYAGFVPTMIDEHLALYRRHPLQKTRGSTRAAALGEEASIAGQWLERTPPDARPDVEAYRRSCVRLARTARVRSIAGRLRPSWASTVVMGAV